MCIFSGKLLSFGTLVGALVQNDTAPFFVSGHNSDSLNCYNLDTVVFCPVWYTGGFQNFQLSFLQFCAKCYTDCKMSSVKAITTSRKHADKPKAKACGHWINPWDSHAYCPTCRESGNARGKLPGDPCMQGHPCQICESFSADQKDKIAT